MFDTMTLTKAVGAFCAMFLVLLVGKWVAEGIYGVHAEGEQAYAIEVAEAEGDGGDAGGGEEVPFEEVFAAADASSGEGVWRQCQACHKLDGSNGVGPYLNGVVGRDIASVDGYSYSDALNGKEEAWTPANLNGFLADPGSWASGTKMTYSGLKKIEDRANLIAWLETQS